MSISLSHAFISVHDQDAALDFYTRLVGLEVGTDYQMEHMRWLTVHPPGKPEPEIALMAVGPPIPEADRPAVAELLAKGALHGVIFAVDDCQATFDRLSGGGAEVLQEPIEQFYGVKDCAFRDPSGNMVRFAERLPAASTA